MAIVDDHALVRAGLRALLHGIPDVQVVAEAGDGREALERIGRARPDVVLLDVSMPGLDGIEVARRLRADRRAPRILFVSMHSDEETIRRAFAAGAHGYLLKSSDVAELRLALESVRRGVTWVSPTIASRLFAAHSGGHVRGGDRRGPLTPRQRDILVLIAEGLSTRAIAHRLDVSAKTVESHRASIMERLGIRTTAGLVRYAIRAGLIDAP